MSSRFLHALAGLTVVLLVLAAHPDAAARTPNVLFIAIDDLNDWVGPLRGHPLARTPHLDTLAARGVTFTNAHCQATVCNPSRTSVLLGLRPGTTGIYGGDTWFRNVPALADRVALPQYFRAHGYTTYTSGKVYHGRFPSGPEARAAEVDVWGPSAGVRVNPPAKLIPPTPMGDHPLMDWGAFPHDEKDQHDSLITDWSIEQLRQAPRDEPFFMATGYFLPHVPIYVTPKRLEQIPDDDRLAPPLLAGDRDDTPRFSWYLHWRLPEPRTRWVVENNQLRPLARSYLAATAFVDAQIGRLLAALDELGLRDDTVVVVWSDHGYHLGEKAITGKNSLWERSTRVPLIFAGPGVPPGRRSHVPVELVDLYPTLADLAGLPPPADLDGTSLLPQLRDPLSPRSRPALTTANPGNHGLRDERWRYIRYADGSEELYDLWGDPQEWRNLAALPEHAATKARLAAFLPTRDAPHAPGGRERVLTYDADSDVASWEGHPVHRDDPIPE